MPCPGPCGCCEGRICVTAAKQCDIGAPLSGVVVVLKNPDGSTFGTQTTGGTGSVCFEIGSATGLFSVTATWTNGKVQTSNVNVTTCQTYGVGFSFLEKSCVTVNGCDGPIADATVTICGHSASYDAGTGKYCFSWASDIPPTTACNVTATLATGPTQTQSVIPSCGISFTFIDRICVTVNGCGFPQPGVSVQIKNGETVLYSDTTGEDGKVCYDPATDLTGVSLTITASKPPRFADATASATAACDMGITITPATGYICCPGCPHPLKRILQVTDANGVHATLSPGPLGGADGCTWGVCYSAPTNDAYIFDFAGCRGGAGSTLFGYRIICSGGVWSIVASWGFQTCPGAGDHYATAGTSCNNGLIVGGLSTGSESASGPLTGDCSIPLVLTGSVPSPGTHLPSPVSGSITITE